MRYHYEKPKLYSSLYGNVIVVIMLFTTAVRYI